VRKKTKTVSGAQVRTRQASRRRVTPARDAASDSAQERPIRVAIVGGGCAGIAAAWHLSLQPEYEVHVFERNSRLGGKGASSRDEDGRIEEHGLHVWLGFYENAFAMMRECYKEVAGRKWPEKERLAHGTFEDAFFPEPHIGVAGRNSARDWVVWSGHLPPAKGLPGTDLDADSNPFTVASYLLRCVALLKTLMLSVIGSAEDDAPGKPRPGVRSTIDEVIDRDLAHDPVRSPELLIEWIGRQVRGGALTAAGAALQIATLAESLLGDFKPSARILGPALNLMQALAAQARKQIQDVVSIDEAIRWKTEVIDIVMAIAVGLYRDRVLFQRRGLDAINNMDYREWLRKHGAPESAVNSRFITGIYDLVFAYEGGDRRRPRLAAGVALRGALRMFFTYRGAMFWRMRSGMGDAVFAPLYRVMLLTDRKTKDSAPRALLPVGFHFLHRLSDVKLEASPQGKLFITELRFRTRGDPDKLDALGASALDRFGCWPNDDRMFGQNAQDGWTGTRVLKIRDHFDVVVIAMGFDDLKTVKVDVAKTAVKGRPPDSLAELVSHEEIETVATQSAQVWMDAELEKLGWYRGSGLISALGHGFDTWADMTHTLAAERAWRRAAGRKVGDPDRARSVAYFCGVATDRDARTEGKLAQDLKELLERGMRHLWPEAYGHRKGESRRTAFDRVVGPLYGVVNVDGSARYTLSLPGSIESRMSPLECPVANMTIAGDWTACGLDVGCVEAAVMSGMLAAHAITGKEPALGSIIGYDHP
jgi:uncharacterized protein with NAD-binding domain and iron-sulfur cluster